MWRFRASSASTTTSSSPPTCGRTTFRSRFREARARLTPASDGCASSRRHMASGRTRAGTGRTAGRTRDCSFPVTGGSRRQLHPRPGAHRADPYDEMPPGCYDRAARIADMDINRTERSLCFPFFPRFCGQLFLEAHDKDLALACVAGLQRLDDRRVVRGDSGGRLIPLGLVPLWDPELAAAEVRRIAARACPRSRSPSSRPTSGCRRSTPTTGTRCSPRATRPHRDLHAHRLGVEDDHHQRRRAARRRGRAHVDQRADVDVGLAALRRAGRFPT